MNDQLLPVQQPASPGSVLMPKTLTEAVTFSKLLAESDMVPKAFIGKPANVLVAVQWGMELGLHPLQAMQNIAVINGKPGLYGDAGKAILLAAGCEIDEDDMEVSKANARARCKITRPGKKPVERTFSVEDAKTAGLWNKEGPWRTYPWRQLAWRAFWFAARDAASDLLRGMAGAEEIIDTPPEKDVTPASEPVGMPRAKSDPKPAANVVDAEVVDRETGEIGKTAGGTRHAGDQSTPPPSNEPTGDQPFPRQDDEKARAEPVPLTPKQVSILQKKLAHAGLTDIDLKAKFGKPLCDGEFPNYAFAEFNAIAAWIDERARG